jgi:RecA/RadA recombinase
VRPELVGGNMARKRKKDLEEEIEEILEPDELSEEQFQEEVRANKKKLKYQNLLSVGSTMLSLACTDTPHGALLKGKYYLVVGASGSGKTWMSMCGFAEGMRHPRFKKYHMIYDDKEEGANMDWEFYFGKQMAKRVGPPEPGRTVKVLDVRGKDTGKRMPQPNSNTIEEFYDSVNDRLDDAEREGTGLIYILDSMDSLTSEMELAKAKENKKLRKQEKETKGAMADGKAKANSTGLRQLMGRLQQSGSILIIVCQERDNLNSPYGGKTFSGGNALPYYATCQFWLKVKEEIKRDILSKKRAIGTLSKMMIYKNRLTGRKEFELFMPIYPEFGFDDIGAQINWLIGENYWKVPAKITSKFDVPEFKLKNVDREELARHIDKNELYDQLSEITAQHWQLIRQKVASKVVRKRRYS